MKAEALRRYLGARRAVELPANTADRFMMVWNPLWVKRSRGFSGTKR